MSKTKQIHLYSKKTFEYLGSAGKIGQGPGEIVVPLFSQMDILKKGIWLYDAGKRQLDYFEIDSILHNKDYLFRKSVPVPSTKAISYYLPYNNELFAFTDQNPHIYISFLDTAGVIRDDLAIPNNSNVYDKDDLINESSLPLIYYHIALNNKRERAAIVYRFAKVVILVQNDGELIRKLEGKDEVFQIPSNDDINQIITYYIVDYDDEYIYCLYKNDKRMNGDIPIYPREMHVFDWDGNQISKMSFDFNISSFKADLTSNTLYTYSPEANSFVLYNIEHLSTNTN